MINNRKIIIDRGCGILSEIQQFADDEFSDFENHTVVPGAIYVIGFQQLMKHSSTIFRLATYNHIKVVFSHPAEGSTTMVHHCYLVKGNLLTLIADRKVFLLCGGSVPTNSPYLTYEYFLPQVLDYNENVDAIKNYDNVYSTDRPYKFLFLNGRSRNHRRYMIHSLSELLDSAIWSNLDRRNGPVKLLDSEYEYNKFNVDFDIGNHSANITKEKLFGVGIWGEIYLNTKQYSDTYFSLVTETVYTSTNSFRTEKIWKPIAIGHPWIAVSNRGYYKDMHNLGFKTFNHVIDESFDFIDNDNDRLDRISQLVKDLCKQDLASFLSECYNVCKYNQQHLADMRLKVRDEFPKRFEQFVTKYINE